MNTNTPTKTTSTDRVPTWPQPTTPQLEEFQFVVTAILLQTEPGKVPRAVKADPKLLTGLDELRQFIDLFPKQLDELNQRPTGGEQSPT